MAKRTIRQRIALDGGEQIKKELAEFGEAGERAFREIQAAANKLDLDKGIGASLQRLQKQFRTVADDFKKVGREIRDVGQNLSTFVTLPILGVGTASLKMAADFESAMNEFVANTGAAGTAFEEAKAKAIELGNASIFSAGESAKAMTELAKVGLDYQQIMEGAAEATVKLAAANGAQLAPAAAVVGDIINQFGLKAKDLGGIINSVSGTLVQSKLDFDGYRLAIGQAGGTAGALGVEFKEFNAVLAATASSFASGSDAGTSFKTFLQRLTPNTVKTVALFKKFNLEFFDAKGNFLGLANAAEELQTKLGHLSDEGKNEVFGELFGTDAIRTALALMKQGGEGIEDMMKKLEATDAADLAAVRVKGLNGALDQLKSAFETLAIAIGDSGLLQFMTDMTLKLTEFIRELAKTNPEMLKWGSVIAGAAAALGPLLVALGLATIGIGGLFGAFSRIIGVIGAVGAAIGRLRVLFLANPWLLAIGLVATGIIAWATRTTEATAALEAHERLVNDVKDAYARVGEEVAKLTQAEKDRLFNATAFDLKGLTETTADEFENLIATLRKGVLGNPILKPLVDELEALGPEHLKPFLDTVAEIGKSNPALADAAAGILEVSKSVEDLIKKREFDTDFLDVLTGKMKQADFDAKHFGDTLGAIKPPAGLTKPVEDLGNAADTTKGKVEALAKAVTVTKFGADGPVKEVFDLASGVAVAVQKSKEELDALKESSTAAKDGIAGVKSEIEGVVRSVPEEMRSQETPADVLVEGLTEVPAAVGSAVDDMIVEIARVGPEAAEAAGEGVTAALVAPFENARNQIGSIWSAISAFATTGVNAILADVGRLTLSINQMIANIIASLQRAAAAAASLRAQAASGRDESGGPGFASGGHVRGPGTGTSDSILAMISNGEFVIRAAAVRKFGPAFFAALNSLRIPEGFSLGGMLDGLGRSMAIPHLASGGLVPAVASSGVSGRPVNVSFDGETFAMVAPDDVAEKLIRAAQRSSIRSGGKKPTWFK